MDRLVKEATEIQLHTNNFNRDNGFMLSQAWYPLINLLHKRRRLERNKTRLRNTATKQKLDTDQPNVGPG
jgi:hypothetical protein